MEEYSVVMVRHGESEWNKLNLFCGWYDSQLNELGKKEAIAAGTALKSVNYNFDIAFTSLLTRAHTTLEIILDIMNITDIPIIKSWRLNERHYGALTGLNKSETAAKYGEEQVAIWRRSYNVPPPPMEPDHPYYEQIINDPRYVQQLTTEEFPCFESLMHTCTRTLPFWFQNIVPEIKLKKSVLIVAHGNSLRGIVKHLDQISDTDISKLNLPTGIPFLYILDEELHPVPDGSLKFLGDPETVQKAIEKVAVQGKAK